MATITGLTAARMLEIEAASVVDGDVVGDNLILTTKGGSQIDAGSVRGPKGDVGPIGQDLAVISAKPVLDVGLLNQIRAGRQLTLQDFTAMGLAAPLGLWNLSDLTDASGNARTLQNKGAVPFAPGINGIANTATQFAGSAAQVLYVVDSGAGDPFKIRAGSFGCWFKTARRSTTQYIFAKMGNSPPGYSWGIKIDTTNVGLGVVSIDGTNLINLLGVSDVCDDRWHFAVVTFDGIVIRFYIDTALEAINNSAYGSINPTNAALNIGGFNGDASTPTNNPSFARVDEAFVIADVLSEDQIRNLYCVKIPHALSSTPIRVSLSVRRRRKGAALVSGDFPTQPLRLHNFSGGSYADDGSNNTNLAIVAGAPSALTGADGTNANAMSFNSTGQLGSTDTGLPSDLTSFPRRSFGCWFKTAAGANPGMTIMGWGAGAVGISDVRLGIANGGIFSTSAGDTIGPNLAYADGLWHFAVEVDDNSPIEGSKRKLYVDGKVVGVSTVMNPIVLGGANRFSVGCAPPGVATQPFTGQVDGLFVCSQALTMEQVAVLYAKGSQALGASPKESGTHIEVIRANDLLAIFDTLESQHQIDLAVA